MGELALARSVFFAAVVIASMGPAAKPTAAECDGPVPSFRLLIPTAESVFVGDVVEIDGPEARLPPPDGDGRSGQFVLEIVESLRGGATGRLALHDVATSPCATMIRAAVGDRIAIVLHGVAYTPPQILNSVTWLAGDAPRWDGLETLTIGEIRDLVRATTPEGAASDAGSTGTTEPPASPVSRPTSDAMTWLAVGALIFAGVVLLAAVGVAASLLRRRRAH